MPYNTFFGFTTFLTGIAFLLMAWTTSDYKYRFRLYISSLSPKSLSTITIFLGISVLICDFFASMEWISPCRHNVCQLVLAALFLFEITYWLFVCFFKPPIFSRRNHTRYTQEFDHVLYSGDEAKMHIIAEELIRSMPQIVKHSAGKYCDWDKCSNITKDALRIIGMMGDKLFCKIVVRKSIDTAMALFYNVEKERKYDIGLDFFAKNFITESLRWEQSFAYRETTLGESILTHWQPVVNIIFGNHQLILNVRNLLNPDYSLTRNWNSRQVYAYVELMTSAFSACYDHCSNTHYFSDVFENLEHSVCRVCWRPEWNGTSDEDDEKDVFWKAMMFYQNVIHVLLNSKEKPKIWRKYTDDFYQKDLLDCLADSLVKVFYFAGGVRGPENIRHLIQYMHCYDPIFSLSECKNAGALFMLKLRRAIVSEIKKDSGLVGIYLLLFFLEIFGLSTNKGYVHKDAAVLKRYIHSYAKTNLLRMYNKAKKLRTFSLPKRMSINEKKRELYLKWESIDRKVVQVMKLS